jgi:uncharacterized protein YutE (UPF0331/DUF86 family)
MSKLLLIDNYDLQDIITVNLERAVQCCVDIATHIIAESDSPAPDSMGKAFLILENLHYIDKKLYKEQQTLPDGGKILKIEKHRVLILKHNQREWIYP